MLTGVHSVIYADDPETARAFFRDVVGWPFVDAHGGWLIFRSGPSEVGVHPTRGVLDSGEDWSTPQHHELCLLCDDLEATIADLRGKGAAFSGEVKDEGFGRTIMLSVPGAGEIMVYQPKHDTAYGLPPGGSDE